MSALRRRHRPARQFVDLAPLVDVTLMLVVFLLLSAQVVDAHAVPVELPTAATGERTPGEDLELVITAGGELLHGERSLTTDDLAELVADGRRAIIQADAAASHGRVVEVVDALRAAGAGGVFYATEKPGLAEW